MCHNLWLPNAHAHVIVTPPASLTAKTSFGLHGTETSCRVAGSVLLSPNRSTRYKQCHISVICVEHTRVFWRNDLRRRLHNINKYYLLSWITDCLVIAEMCLFQHLHTIHICVYIGQVRYCNAQHYGRGVYGKYQKSGGEGAGGGEGTSYQPPCSYPSA